MDGQIKLSHDQYQDVLRAVQVLDQLKQVTTDLEACGEDCQLRRNKIDNLRLHLQNLANHFAPVP